jgi:hypothetical protein
MKKMMFIHFSLIMSIFILSCVSQNYFSKAEIEDYLKDLPFEMGTVSVPVFPKNNVDITGFGAIGDGHTNNTEAINSAIQACAKEGGGKVIIPPGMWFTGPIKLENNINLHIQRGAVLMFSGRFEDYPVIETFWNGLPMKRCTSPISGWDLENIAITGEGVIDGNGEAWRPVKRWKMTDLKWEALVNSGGVIRYWKRTDSWFPSEAAFLGEALVKELDKKKDATIEEYASAREYLRPALLQLVCCKKVLLDGLIFQNSPMWNMHLLLSENIVIRNIKARNPWNAQNGDGLDLESCKNALVYNCSFDVGDDAICMKSGRNEYGRKRGVPIENIVIRDCIVLDGHTGFAIGSEMSGGARNILLKDCQFLGTMRGVRIKSNRERGGVVENIFIENILAEDIQEDVIWLDKFYQKKTWNKYNAVDKEPPPVAPVTVATPLFRDIFIKNIICKSAKRAVFIEGLPEMTIKNISMDGLFISSTKGLDVSDINGLKLTNSRIFSSTGPVLFFKDSKNIVIESVEFPEERDTFLKLRGSRTDSIKLKGYTKDDMNGLLDIGKEVKLTNKLIIHVNNNKK